MPRSQGTSRKGKPKKLDRAAGMGRALQKAHHKKFKPKSNGSSQGSGMAASGAQNIGMENSTSKQSDNVKSVLETNDLTDFLARAELADREFASEKEQFIILDENAQQVQFDEASTKFDFAELSVPRRPKWDETTTPEELEKKENEAFLSWRRSIAMHEETVMSSGVRIVATPFEKNLEVWRQLWRVLERSDCIAMVVDGRNPLFYISMDLRKYVEDELGKAMILIMNKCDYLTKQQRKIWHEHFIAKGLDHVFFSAFFEQEVLDKKQDEIETTQEKSEELKGSGEFERYKEEYGEQEIQDNIENKESKEEVQLRKPIPRDLAESKQLQKMKKTLLNRNSVGIDKPLTRMQLLQVLRDYAQVHKSVLAKQAKEYSTTSRIEFGMVGFPNVGKSSVLNVLVGASKRNHHVNRVGVASQPGKTKHFQTLHVPDHDNITLCDCPGLVFPSLVSSAADLIVAGVYPLAQVRDFWPAVEMITRRIPREILEAYYGLELPRPSALDATHGTTIPLSRPTAEEFLRTYCIARSLLASSSGIPDYHRAARVVLSDYVNGKLLFCHAPPTQGDIDQFEAIFQRETISTVLCKTKKIREKLAPVSNVESKSGNLENCMDLEEDISILELIDASAENGRKATKGKRGKKHKSVQKWGKKGRKNRSKDPYGCHTEPDEQLLESSRITGLSVKAGKYSSTSYTRPDYKGAKSI